MREVDVAAIGVNCPNLKDLDLSQSTVLEVFGPPAVGSFGLFSDIRLC